MIEAACRAAIDKHELGQEERGIVGLLLELGKPTGLEAIASALRLDLETLRDVHEPRLERAGLVERTVHGRVATEKARAWYGQSISKTLAAPDAEAKEGECPGGDQSHGEAEGKGEDPSGDRSRAGPHGSRPTIPILRLPFRFG